MEHNFDKYNNSAVDTQNTPYDYGSVMHYGLKYFSKNDLPTIEPLQSGVTIGQREAPSAIDIEEVQLFYGCIVSSTAPVAGEHYFAFKSRFEKQSSTDCFVFLTT